MLPIWFRPLVLIILLLGWGVLIGTLVAMIRTKRQARLDAEAQLSLDNQAIGSDP